ncbi:hypothetical protein CRE_30129 [Caenorhabditis remanei]|uniref:Uncharacterized protein n=1 Tax=Caenorhabditis remanei TaxID=31234 RepID=E3N630_CAERE|nr:hypothetical protein CRE_30129 [Caenorhabditis remanei]
MFTQTIRCVSHILSNSLKLLIIMFLIIYPFDRTLTKNLLATNGFYIGAMYNFCHYDVREESGMLVVYDKLMQIDDEDYLWWARIQPPSKFGLDYYNLMTNPQVTMEQKLETYIPSSVALTLQFAGKGLRLVNKAAPIVFAVYIIQDATESYTKLNCNAVGTQIIFSKIAKYLVTWNGAKLGALIGTKILPGVGTLFGGLLGGVVARSQVDLEEYTKIIAMIFHNRLKILC